MNNTSRIMSTPLGCMTSTEKRFFLWALKFFREWDENDYGEGELKSGMLKELILAVDRLELEVEARRSIVPLRIRRFVERISK